ncbi:MAG: isoprenylcysteine carboxylmethyltransferase family protein [Terracidiphilus sp.]|jgi:protein-S-isoprenylcysteine O-methyltransferase Ste14
MTEPGNPPQPATEQPACPQPDPAPRDWIARWQRIARRIRVPLGFLTTALYLFELVRRAPQPWAVALSLALVLPGLALRAYASGYLKKNCELAVTGPYAYTRNPLYLGSMMMAAGFALALLSWPVALALALGFAVIYVPVIASEERFLRAQFPGFDDYCRQVPRFLPRLIPKPDPVRNPGCESGGSFSLSLYIQHREYNAGMGVVLLYLSLLLLRPLLAVWVNLPQ